MPIYIDMMDFPVEIAERPQRIISLVPSLSMLLSDIGVGERLVGITKFCVHPETLRTEKTVIGGTKLLHMEKIQELKPDLIIANKEENNQADIEVLQAEFPVWISDITTFDDALSAIEMIGEIVDCREQANALRDEIQTSRSQYSESFETDTQRVAYVIWKEPMMVAGQGTFIDTMLKEGGWTNVFEQHPRYPAVTLKGLKAMKPDLIFLSSEPFPFSEKHIAQFEEILSRDRIHLVDGEVFSWYGSRLRDSFNYFRELRTKEKIK